MPDLFAEVAVNSTLPHRQTFSYRVPDGMAVVPGHAVYVPFGRRTLQGIVLEVHDTPVFSEPEKIRTVRSVIGEAPVLDADRVRLARWVADHYLAPVFDAVALLLPPGFERKPVTVVRALVQPDELGGLDLRPRAREMLATLIERGARSLDALRTEFPYPVEPVVAQLEREGLAVRDFTLSRPGVIPKTIELLALALPPDAARALVERAEPPRASRRAAVIERLLEKRTLPRDEASRLAGTAANLERLLRTGTVRPDREAHSIELAIAPTEAAAEARALRRTKRATGALRAIDALAAESPQALPALRATGVETVTLRWLADLGAVRAEQRPVERDPLEELGSVARRPPASLLPAQQAAAGAVCAALDGARHEVFLLHGVTGSGKTEVYLHALDRCVAAGKRAIVLVPEIALTPQTIRRFRERVERVAVLHSGLTPGELFDQWHGIAAGRYDVVVGPRSALFAPQPDLALIVLDEEHEWSYKQHDPAPRYHARDVALELGRLKGAPVILGSATPDVGSWFRAEQGAYTLLPLPERIRPVVGADGAERPETSPVMPSVSVIDLREELKGGNTSMFSGELRSAVAGALAHDEQVILFLNRRGLAGHVQCRDCGDVPECSSCHVAMTYHRQYDRLVCHQCNRRLQFPRTCRSCGSPRIRLVGAGVEKVEAEAARVFPHARLLRWDRDVTRGRQSHDRILRTFLAHEADILIGTQMLAKGLDMPLVTVVGVVNADIGLHLPDFRAGERTFQLLTQVAGRAGRGKRAGRVVIQTYQPEHYAIDTASRYDYAGFAAAELDTRRAAGYPPFGRLVRLLFSHANARRARHEALRLHRALSERRREAGSDVDLVGPSPSYVPRVRGRWRWQILLRGRDPAALVRGYLLPPNWSVDVDPVSLV